jgi:hypothetical protein
LISTVVAEVGVETSTLYREIKLNSEFSLVISLLGYRKMTIERIKMAAAKIFKSRPKIKRKLRK